MVDHLVFGVPELAAGVALLQERLGVRAAPGGSHEGRGSHNALLALGDGAYLEVIAPDPHQPPPPRPRPFGLDRLTQARLITFAVAAPHYPLQQVPTDGTQRLEGWRKLAVEGGYDPGPVTAMSRRRPDGELLRWHLCQHGELPCGGLVPFLIDWGSTRSPAATAPSGCRLLGLQATHPDPPAVCAALRAVGVALPVKQGPEPALRATFATPRGRVELT